MILCLGVRLKFMRQKLKLQLFFCFLLISLMAISCIWMMPMTCYLNLENKLFYCTLFLQNNLQANWYNFTTNSVILSTSLLLSKPISIIAWQKNFLFINLTVMQQLKVLLNFKNKTTFFCPCSQWKTQILRTECNY